jgi:soluble lytic murein transglycosylase
MKRVRLMTFAALLFALMVVTPSNAPSALRDASETDVAIVETVEALDLTLDVEKQIILDTVRHYRPTTDDEWVFVLADTVHRESLAAGIDPLLVAAIVAKESSFQSQVVSSAGAVGLMQVRPWVARDVAERRLLEWRGLETLHDPDANVRLGILYYLELMNRFDSDPVTALEAYNRGPSRVSRELRDGTFSESRYSERVLGLYEKLDAERSTLVPARI